MSTPGLLNQTSARTFKASLRTGSFRSSSGTCCLTNRFTGVPPLPPAAAELLLVLLEVRGTRAALASPAVGRWVGAEGVHAGRLMNPMEARACISVQCNAPPAAPADACAPANRRGSSGCVCIFSVHFRSRQSHPGALTSPTEGHTAPPHTFAVFFSAAAAALPAHCTSDRSTRNHRHLCSSSQPSAHDSRTQPRMLQRQASLYITHGGGKRAARCGVCICFAAHPLMTPPLMYAVVLLCLAPLCCSTTPSPARLHCPSPQPTATAHTQTTPPLTLSDPLAPPSPNLQGPSLYWVLSQALLAS